MASRFVRVLKDKILAVLIKQLHQKIPRKIQNWLVGFTGR